MRGNELRIIKNTDVDKLNKLNTDDFGKKRHVIKFVMFIALLLSLFGGILFVKDKFQNIKSTREDLIFQKQKLVEDRLLMEKTFKEENDKLLKLKEEYEGKNKELTETLNSIKIKEETLNSELKKIEELKSLLTKHLVDLYGISMDKQYNDTSSNEDKQNSGVLEDDKSDSAVHTGMILGDNNEKDEVIKDEEKILSVANPDWFIKFDSLGEFSY